jgi:hypothetical protein
MFTSTSSVYDSSTFGRRLALLCTCSPSRAGTHWRLSRCRNLPWFSLVARSAYRASLRIGPCSRKRKLAYHSHPCIGRPSYLSRLTNRNIRSNVSSMAPSALEALVAPVLHGRVLALRKTRTEGQPKVVYTVDALAWPCARTTWQSCPACGAVRGASVAGLKSGS